MNNAEYAGYAMEWTMPNMQDIQKPEIQDIQKGAYPKHKKKSVATSLPRSSTVQKRVDGLKNSTGKITG
jgi:hypothetical protein